MKKTVCNAVDFFIGLRDVLNPPERVLLQGALDWQTAMGSYLEFRKEMFEMRPVEIVI